MQHLVVMVFEEISGSACLYNHLNYIVWVWAMVLTGYNT